MKSFAECDFCAKHLLPETLMFHQNISLDLLSSGVNEDVCIESITMALVILYHIQSERILSRLELRTLIVANLATLISQTIPVFSYRKGRFGCSNVLLHVSTPEPSVPLT